MNKLKYQYRIYGRQKGRKKIEILNESFYINSLINIEKDIKKNKKIIIDVGSGSGENSIFLAKKNPNSLIIACEPFLDGNINLCNQLYKMKIKNVKFYTKNVLKLFNQIKNNTYFSEIWILFPDPWPKKKHHKRRLLNYNFFKKIYFLIKKRGKIFIATDSESYLKSILMNLYNLQSIFKWENQNPQNWSYIRNNLPHTKFFKKANSSQRCTFFIKLRKI